eukprot:gb/GECH01002616.1/.p1 GENE.gb/GECH01002616.1/~~gb/GECH01002616.1/.p1  ORF type:complete len:101 (+),score=31.46 gb/GECH01002616.1/:1-303(+)
MNINKGKNSLKPVVKEEEEDKSKDEEEYENDDKDEEEEESISGSGQSPFSATPSFKSGQPFSARQTTSMEILVEFGAISKLPVQHTSDVRYSVDMAELFP